MYKNVKQFHTTFGVPAPTEPGSPPPKLVRQRCKWQLEETLELLEACFPLGPARRTIDHCRGMLNDLIDNDTVGVDLEAYADANADIRYIAYGSDIVAGINSEETDAEVHRSNMTKDANPNGGKISKGVNYSPPDIGSILNRR